MRRQLDTQLVRRRVYLILLGSLAPILGASGQTHLVQKFDGNTSTTTSDFTVGDKWEVAWETPMPLRITLLSKDGQIVAGTAGIFRGSFYQPKGGTFYLQVDGASPGAMARWHLSVIEMGAAGQVSAVGPHMDFVPPSILPAAQAAASTVSSSSTNAAPAIPPPPSIVPPGGTSVLANSSSIPTAPAAAAPAPPPVVNLTEEQTSAVVMIEGDKMEGTGFLVKMPDGPAVVTNIHVIAGNPNVRILTNTGAQITILGLKGATDRDLALFSIQDAHYNYLTLNSAISSSVQIGDNVITPGNSQGGEVVLATHGNVVAVGPQRIEFNNPIYHGNSGGPVFQTKTGKVLGVVTEAMKVDTDNDLDKSSYSSKKSAITSQMRYFGLRLDTVPQWETYDPARFLTETGFLERFHQQSRRLDSYLNATAKTDAKAGSEDDDDDGTPSSRLYLSDTKIVKANDDFFQQAAGGSSSERLDAFRGWIFSLNGIADTDMEPIQNMANFYTFNQQRAHREIAYRQALKTELDSFGNDISRVESIGHRSN